MVNNWTQIFEPGLNAEADDECRECLDYVSPENLQFRVNVAKQVSPETSKEADDKCGEHLDYICKPGQICRGRW